MRQVRIRRTVEGLMDVQSLRIQGRWGSPGCNIPRFFVFVPKTRPVGNQCIGLLELQLAGPVNLPLTHRAKEGRTDYLYEVHRR